MREAGAFGVCLFFFLSAFLITELLAREQEATGTIRLGAFYARRILRIWPLYFAILLLDFVQMHLRAPGVFSGGRLAAFFLLAGNWYVARHGWIESLTTPLWSISVEEQFYLLWPSVRRYTGRNGSLLFSCAAFLLGFIALRPVFQPSDPVNTGLWVNSFVQFQFFASGALLAIALKNKTPALGTSARLCLLTMGAAAFYASQGVFHAKAGFNGGLLGSVIPGYLTVNAGCVLVFLAFLGAEFPGRLKPLVYLGKISYGLYVFHLGLLSLSGKLFFPSGVPFSSIHQTTMGLRALTAFGGTVVVAAASYRFFEAPILRFKRRFEILQTRPV